MLELPEGLLRNVAERLDATSALALSMASRTLREATGGIAVAKAVSASPNVPAAVRAGLDRAAALQEGDAIDRREILRSVAARIGQSPGQAVGMVREFLRTIEPLSPVHRADALVALEASLPRLPEYQRSAAFALVRHSLALEKADALPDDARGPVLAAMAEHVSATEHAGARLAIFDALANKVGELQAAHRSEALTAVASKLAALTDEAAQPQARKLLALARELAADGLGQVPLELLQKMGAPSEPSAAFDLAWNDAMRLAEGVALPQREQMGALLAQRIRHLAATVRHEAFDRTMALLLPLQQEPRAVGLEHLAKTIEFLPEAAPESTSERHPGRADALHGILASLAGMREPDLALMAAAAAVQHVTHRRDEMFDPVFTAVMSLPLSWQRQGGLEALVDAAKLQAHGRAHTEFSRILGSLASFGEAERTAIVLKAARALGDVQQPGSLPLLILGPISDLPPFPRSKALQQVFQRTHWPAMSPEDLGRTVDAVLPLISQLPVRYAGAVAGDAAAFLPIQQMEAVARTSVFTRLLQHAVRTPDSTLLEALSRTMLHANDPALRQSGFAPLLTLVGEREAVSPGALWHLAGQLRTLPEAQLQAAWQQVRSLAGRIPPTSDMALDGVMSGVVEAVPLLNPQMQAEALAWVQQSIPKLFNARDHSGARSKTLSRLASVIPSLAEALRQSVFTTVLNHAPQVLEADRRAESYMLRESDGRQLHPDQRTAELLAQLARAAGTLSGLAPRVCANQILTALQDVAEPASRAEVLKSLAREALPAALENTFGPRVSAFFGRHVSSESLLQTFAEHVKALPPDVRFPALQHMLQEAQVHSGSHGSSSRDDKSGKLTELLEELMR